MRLYRQVLVDRNGSGIQKFFASILQLVRYRLLLLGNAKGLVGQEDGQKLRCCSKSYAVSCLVELGLGQGDLNLGLTVGVPGLESVKNGPLSDQGSAGSRKSVAVYLVGYRVNGESAIEKIPGAGVDCGQESAHRRETVRLGSAHIIGRLPHAELVGKGLVYACLKAVGFRANRRLRRGVEGRSQKYSR